MRVRLRFFGVTVVSFVVDSGPLLELLDEVDEPDPPSGITGGGRTCGLSVMVHRWPRIMRNLGTAKTDSGFTSEGLHPRVRRRNHLLHP